VILILSADYEEQYGWLCLLSLSVVLTLNCKSGVLWHLFGVQRATSLVLFVWSQKLRWVMGPDTNTVHQRICNKFTKQQQQWDPKVTKKFTSKALGFVMWRYALYTKLWCTIANWIFYLAEYLLEALGFRSI
jgi:hypothetical protein